MSIPTGQGKQRNPFRVFMLVLTIVVLTLWLGPVLLRSCAN